MLIDQNNQPETLDFNEGCYLLVDKPQGYTSFDVVKYVREQYPGYVGKIGHAGTLDPIATGLLILCTGQMTKQIEAFQKLPKTYLSTFHMGATTPSFDSETAIDHRYSLDQLDEHSLRETAAGLTGEIEQTPPAYSAAMINGKRAYKEARKGNEVQLKAKPVVIHDFEITAIEWPCVHCRIRCSKGTYIRSLARDLGQALNTGAYMTALRRTAIGSHDVADALTLPAIDKLFKQVKIPAKR